MQTRAEAQARRHTPAPEPCCVSVFAPKPSLPSHLLAFQTALLHLKPLPKPNCHTRSPAATPLKVSMYASTYQMLLLLTLPYLRTHHKRQRQQRGGGGSSVQG